MTCDVLSVYDGGWESVLIVLCICSILTGPTKRRGKRDIRKCDILVPTRLPKSFENSICFC
jgi:hypothetical protein